MNRKQAVKACLIMMVIGAALGATVIGQGRGQGANAPLQMLKQEITKAGATALDSTQESAIQAAIANFRNANQPTVPDAAEQAARESYINAILAGDKSSAKNTADQIAGLMARHQQARLEGEAAFSIQVLSILHSDQIAALQSSIGKDGLVRLVASLAGPGGGFGRGGMMGPNMNPMLRGNTGGMR